MKGRWWIREEKEDKARKRTREGGSFGCSNIFILGEGEKNWRREGEGKRQLGPCICSATVLCLQT